MAEKVIGPTGSQRRRWLFICFLVAALGASAFVIAGAQATPPEQNPPGYFELDKDLINNEQPKSSDVGTVLTPSLVALGTLGGNINASVTSFTVCQAVTTNPTPLPITIQIDAERMTVGAIASASGGGCSGAFKRTYSSITRGVSGGSAAASHSASGVQGFVTLLTFNATVGDDWKQVKDAVDANNLLPTPAANPCSGAGWTGNTNAKACDFIADPPGQTVFSTGGSKDDLDINIGTPPNLTPSWRYTNQSVPDADDIQDGYAIKYQGPNATDHQFLYFGADRTAVNGAKDMGFWFFKGPVGLNPDGTFSGQHQVGDLLLLGTFTNGGATTTIRIFKWVGLNNPTDPADTNGVLKSGGNFGDCVPGGSSDGCNTVNNATIKSPWAYQSKISGTPANTIYAGGMMEGGVDLTSLKLEGCFSSFLAETRSSPEVGAQLKDFLLGKFEACSSGLKTTPQDNAGNDLADTDNPANGLPDISIGTGSVQVKDSADLEVGGTGGTFSGTLSFHLCGPIAAPATCTTNGTAVALDGTNPVTTNGIYHSVAATVTSVGRYCWRGDFVPTTPGVPEAHDSSLGECFEVKPVTPALTTDATDAVEIGNAIDDTAHLTGTANRPGTPNVINPTTPGGTAGGTITFKLYGPAATATCTDTGTGANLVATRVVNIKTSDSYTGGDGFYKASDGTGTGSLSTLAAGTYYWTAQYSGDSPNTLGVGPTTCGEDNESSRIVDARISITPTATNEVGVEHTFTVLVEATDAAGDFQPVEGVNPDVTLTPSNGASDPLLGVTDNCASPGGTGSDGKCTVTFHSDTAGQVTGHATVTFDFGGVQDITRETDGTAGNSGDAVKTYVDAYISVTPLTATNEVNDPHEITATVKQDAGDGAGFVNAPDGTLVTFSLSNNTASADFVNGVDTCTTTAGECSVFINTTTAGSVDIHATTTFDVGGVSLTRSTGSGGNNSADANKVYVDAYITLTPLTADNTVGDMHTVHVYVAQDDGLPAVTPPGPPDNADGFGPAPIGTLVTVTLTDDATSQYQVINDGCATLGLDANGMCDVSFTSPTPGTVTIHAAVSFDVGGVTLDRETDGLGLNSTDAVKNFFAGSISWTKVDNAARLLGGATFDLCKTANYNFVTQGFDSITPDCSTFGPVVDNTGQLGYVGKDNDPDAGEFEVVGVPLGRYTVQETAAPPGFELDTHTRTVELIPGDAAQTISVAFVNSRPILKITGLSYTNAPEGAAAQPDGIFKGVTTFTVNLKNYGTADAVLTHSSLAVSNAAPSTGLTCDGGSTLGISQTIAPGASNSPAITLTCHYDHPNGKTITALLTVNYTTNGLERTASGSPATISFTVDPHDLP